MEKREIEGNGIEKKQKSSLCMPRIDLVISIPGETEEKEAARYRVVSGCMGLYRLYRSSISGSMACKVVIIARRQAR